MGVTANPHVRFAVIDSGNRSIALICKTIFSIAIFVALVLYAFRFSLGSRPLLAPSSLDD